MDVNMPVMDGIEATRIANEKILHGELPPTPIIALSAGQLDNPEQDTYFRELGFAAYFRKPIPIEQFITLLRIHRAL